MYDAGNVFPADYGHGVGLFVITAQLCKHLIEAYPNRYSNTKLPFYGFSYFFGNFFRCDGSSVLELPGVRIVTVYTPQRATLQTL